MHACKNDTCYVRTCVHTRGHPSVPAHLFLLLLGGRAASSKEVLLAEKLGLDLSSLGIAQHCVVGWKGSEGLNLRPAHQVKGSHVLIQEHLGGGEGRGGEGRGGEE